MEHDHPDYHPPHIAHGHPPHIDVPPPQIQYIHPDVLRAEEQARQASIRTVLNHPVLATGVAAICLVPTAYFSYRALDEIGWFLIIPPACVVLFGIAALLWIIYALALWLLLALARLVLVDDTFHSLEAIVGPIVDVVAMRSTLWGIPAGFIAYLVVHLGVDTK